MIYPAVGLLAHSTNLGCSKCYKELGTGQIGNLDCSGFNVKGWKGCGYLYTWNKMFAPVRFKRFTSGFSFSLFRTRTRSFSSTNRILCGETERKTEIFGSPDTKLETFREIQPKLVSIKCNGCGSPLQSESPQRCGFLPSQKLAHILRNPLQGEFNDETDQPICQRCHYLKNYNSALNITLSPEDYKCHLLSLKDKRALVLLMVDAVDFPGSLFPELNEVIGHGSQVNVVVNKIDLLPNLNRRTLVRLEDYIRSEASKGSLKGHNVEKIWFVSSKTSKGVEELSEGIVFNWGNRGDVYLLGCTNVGKSSLFNHLIGHLCGAKPGDVETVSGLSAPAPVVSHWPGTTLGLISFPILSMGKRRRLLAQVHRTGLEVPDDESKGNHGLKIRELFIAKKNIKNPGVHGCLPDIEEVLDEIGIKKSKKKTSTTHYDSNTTDVPKNRFWLCDTPGAINSNQVE